MDILRISAVLLNTAKNTREQGTTSGPIAIRVRVRAAYLGEQVTTRDPFA